MAKRRKKLLFDVIGASDGSDIAAGRRGKTAPPAGFGPPRDGELRITRSFAAALVLVFVVFMIVSYYVGVRQGALSLSSDGSDVALRRDDAGNAAAPEGEYAVRARVEAYSRFTHEDLIASFQRQMAFLKDRGFSPVDALDYEDEVDPTSGRIVLWVGRGPDRDSLQDLAGRIRSVAYENEYVFATAHPALYEH